MQLEIDRYDAESETWFFRLWVARVDTLPVGFLLARRDGEIDFVAVDDGYQGCKVARALITAARAYFAKQHLSLSHGYPVSPKGAAVMAAYGIEGRLLSRRQRERTVLMWSDEEAASKSREIMEKIRGNTEYQLPQAPTSPRELTLTVDCRVTDAPQNADAPAD